MKTTHRNSFGATIRGTASLKWLRKLAALAVAACSLPPILAALTPAQQAYIKPSNTAGPLPGEAYGNNQNFGWSVAIDGDTIVIGAPFENSSATGVNGNQANNGAPDSGAAYVFVREGMNWVQQAYLKASNTSANDLFGWRVAISGRTVVVGAVFEDSSATGVNGNQGNNSATDSGAAYVFVREGTNWVQQAYLKASNTGANDHFGFSVAISGDTVVVGADKEDSNATGVDGNQGNNSAVNSGAVYVFVRSGTNWSQQAYLKASNTGGPSPGDSDGDNFGASVAISGDTIVVGAHEEDSNAAGVNGNQSDNSSHQAGAAYVFVRDGTQWSQQAYLKSSNSGPGDSFGWSVALLGDALVVGAPDEASHATGVNGNQGDNSVPEAGAAYLFVRNGTNWTQEAYLKASNPDENDHFGVAVAVLDNLVLVGAAQESSSARGVDGDQTDNSAPIAGAAYAFVRNGTNWTQQAYLKPSNPQPFGEFGISLAVSGHTVVIGADGDFSRATGVNGDQSDRNAPFSGAAYVFTGLNALRTSAQSVYVPYTFTTLAGGGGFTSPDQPGAAVRFWGPTGVVVDSAGNLYVSDLLNHAIRKVTPGGMITTLAGLPGSTGSADGQGSEARFLYPDRLVLDPAGNLFVSDNGNTIRKVTPEGVVTTIAGLAGRAGSADGIGSAARFNGPSALALDNAGNLYVADGLNFTIRKLTLTGTNWTVTTIAGRAGSFGSADGIGSAARFDHPAGLAIDRAGNLYVSDPDNFTVRKVTPAGTNWVVSTLAGLAGQPGSADGTNSGARFNAPLGMALDPAGNLYVSDLVNCTVRKIAPEGTNWVVTTLAGLAGHPGAVDGVGSEARFDFPYGLAVDNSGSVYVADWLNDAVRKLTPLETNWVATTLAGFGGNLGSADGTLTDAKFKGPAGVAADGLGGVYIADQVNHTIRKLTSGGEVTTLAGLAGSAGAQDGTGSEARFSRPQGVAVDGAGNVYVGDFGNNTIRKITPAGAVTTLAGLPGIDGGSADGTGSAARFSNPYGLALDSATNLYVADSNNYTIRRVSPAGFVTTRAGSAGNPGSADGIGTAARFNNPSGVAVDNASNIYVADTWNHTIRKVTPARVVTTIAGLAGNPGSADGTGSDARFYFPSGIAADGTGNVYVADAYNNTIRKLTLAGTNWLVTTLGGMSGFYGTADGTGSAARFSNPNGIAVDSDGALYVADFYFNTIRKGYPPPKILNAAFISGQFRFDLTAPPGRSAVVEVSTDLMSWLPVWTNTSALHFSDPQSGISSYRFYRARMP